VDNDYTPVKRQKQEEQSHNISFISSSPQPSTTKKSPLRSRTPTNNTITHTNTDTTSTNITDIQITLQTDITHTNTDSNTTNIHISDPHKHIQQQDLPALFSPLFTFHSKDQDTPLEVADEDHDLTLADEEELQLQTNTDSSSGDNDTEEGSLEDPTETEDLQDLDVDEEILKEQQLTISSIVSWYDCLANPGLDAEMVSSDVDVDVEVEDSDQHRVVEFNPYLFIKNLPAHQPCLRTLLPPRLSTDPKICLVLDLDETLVHCSTEMLFPADVVFPVFFNNVQYTVFARKRPYIEEFLSAMSRLFEIVVFTASQEVYADRLLNILDPERKYIRHRLFRDSCICVDGNYLKDLTILGRDLSQVVIVDNSPQAFGYQIDNGIPIESWFDDDQDEELLRLVPFLQSVVDQPDVRPILREKFKLYELISRSC